MFKTSSKTRITTNINCFVSYLMKVSRNLQIDQLRGTITCIFNKFILIWILKTSLNVSNWITHNSKYFQTFYTTRRLLFLFNSFLFKYFHKHPLLPRVIQARSTYFQLSNSPLLTEHDKSRAMFWHLTAMS